jgi:hypothetical protein
MCAKSFFYVSLGILALAAAYHLGATNAVAQAPSNPVVAGGFSATNTWFAFTANGDVYLGGFGVPVWQKSGNVFGGGPTPTPPESWGQVKVEHR